jgi:hypothetical protein
MRLVLIIITYLLFIPAGNTADFAKYKSTCSDIGFTPDTDPFADCVLKLYKRDKAKTAEKNTQERENIDSSNAIERDRQAQIERERERQAERQRQAHYERERLKLERQRLEMERQRAQKAANREQFEREQRAFQMMIDWGNGGSQESRDFDRCVWECEGGRTYCERICR